MNHIFNAGDKVVYDGSKFRKELHGKIGEVIAKIAKSPKLVVAFPGEEEEKTFILPPTVIYPRG